MHLILGTTIFLVMGLAPAAIGLAIGLLIQGLFFAQFDLPQYGINVTTLLASIFILNAAVKRIIPADTAYKDISYKQMVAMSLVWEGAIAVSYTHLRAHETHMYLVCRLLLEKNIFLMIRRPPRSTPCASSAASDVYKRQGLNWLIGGHGQFQMVKD